jgi:hypothetical protein
MKSGHKVVRIAPSVALERLQLLGLQRGPPIRSSALACIFRNGVVPTTGESKLARHLELALVDGYVHFSL